MATSAESSEELRMRVLIVDDEPLARGRLRELLEAQPDVEIVGECCNGLDAVEAIQKSSPDLLFLDVQMPEVDGFQVLERVGAERVPAVVFVTAYDQHALRAFDVYALDFLLKPFDRERFQRALDRVRAQRRFATPGALNQRILSLLESMRPSQKTSDRLVVRVSGRVFFFKYEEIDWVHGEGNYVRIQVGKQSHLVRETMSELEGRLDETRFLRIHKSIIVNTERIKEIQPLINGAHVVVLYDGTRLTWSRGYRSRLRELTGTED